MFRKQTAIRNQVEKPELENLKKGNQDEADTIEAVVIEVNQHVSLTFSSKYLINFLQSAMPVLRRKFRSHHFSPHFVFDALLITS